MRITIYNRKYNDSVEFVYESTEVTEEIRKDVLKQVHDRGWEDKDCWSEVD